MVGLKLSLLLAFVCLTGTIATISHEIEWLVNPAVRGSSNGQTDDYPAMWGKLRARYPDAFISGIGSFDRADSTYFAREATVTFPDGTSRRVFIDAATLAITGEQNGNSFHSIMRGLHYYLLLPGNAPFYLVTSLGLVLALSLVTGLLTYKKFWRGWLRTPRWQRSTRTWAGDLHRLIGLWSLWFVALMSVTAIWYLVERALPPTETPQPVARVRHWMAPVDEGHVRSWVNRARREFPGLSITGIYMPYGTDDPVTIQGNWHAWLVRERTNAVFIDPATSRVIGTRSAEKISLFQRWIHTADPLHFGNFAGLASKLVWVLFGLLLTAMSITGVMIYSKRTLRGGPGA